MSGTLSSDSNDSVHNQAEVASQHASTVGTAGSKSSRSMAVLNTAVRHATDGFIGILDMFGFEDPKVFTHTRRAFHFLPLQFQIYFLFINIFSRVSWNIYASICALRRCSIFSTRTSSNRALNRAGRKEYNANSNPITWTTFRASTSFHLWYFRLNSNRNSNCVYCNNNDAVDLQRTGLLSMLDVECAARGTPESYVQKVRLQHKHNGRLFEPKSVTSSDIRTFGIQHFAGRVIYDASDCLGKFPFNKSQVPIFFFFFVLLIFIFFFLCFFTPSLF